MTALDLLRSLDERAFTFELRDGRLFVRPPSKLTEEDKAGLREHAPQVYEFLRRVRYNGGHDDPGPYGGGGLGDPPPELDAEFGAWVRVTYPDGSHEWYTLRDYQKCFIGPESRYRQPPAKKEPVVKEEAELFKVGGKRK